MNVAPTLTFALFEAARDVELVRVRAVGGSEARRCRGGPRAGLPRNPASSRTRYLLSEAAPATPPATTPLELNPTRGDPIAPTQKK